MNKTRNMWKYFSVLLIMVIIVSFSYYTVSAHPGVKVTLSLDDIQRDVYTEALTVGELLKELVKDHRLVLEDSMNVSPSRETEIKPGMTIKINTIKQYTLIEQGVSKQIESYEDEVQAILDEVNFKLTDNTYTVPGPSAKIKNGSTIEVIKVEKNRQTKVAPVPAPVEYIDNPEMFQGQQKVVQEGKNGLERITTESIYYNGRLMESRIISSEVIEATVGSVIERGIKEAPVVETATGPLRYKSVIVMEATAYDNSYASCGKHPGDPYYGITASGTVAGPGTVAVDPKVIPLGTKLYVESMDEKPTYGYATATDTGGAIVGNRIDLWKTSNAEAMEFGRRNVKVYVLFDE
ncbi:MAG: hypothetical protein GXZ11_04110 [Tissierellia bacterium]|nr:hypothetical protein [Tissierellia bacterium]